MKFSGFRILKSLKIASSSNFRIQDPESSGSEDPAGKSQEGRKVCVWVSIQLDLKEKILRLDTGEISPLVLERFPKVVMVFGYGWIVVSVKGGCLCL